jgi:uncharacterized protein (TIGR02391 family)
MNSWLDSFEKIARVASALCIGSEEEVSQSHPFDERNMHPEISNVSVSLFNDGHYSQATFEAFKFIDLRVKTLSNENETGSKLMMAAFNETNPKIKLTALNTESEKNEQTGYKFIFAGAMIAIRNPRGHEINNDPIDTCLDHLSLASFLLRRLENTLP